MRNVRSRSLLVFFSVTLLLATTAMAQSPGKISSVDNPPQQSSHQPGLCVGTSLIFQPPNQSNGLFSDSDCDLCGTGQQSLADDFTLAAEETITEVAFFAGYFPTNIPLATDDWTVIFHADAAGAVGAAIETQLDVPSTRVATGVVLFGVDEYQVNLQLNPVTLSAGTYWIEIFNDSTGSTESVFWEAGDLDAVNGRLNSSFAFETPGITWNAGSPDVAFELCAGQVIQAEPIPSLDKVGLVSLLLLLATCGVIFLRRIV